jgi:hypothetical protein
VTTDALDWWLLRFPRVVDAEAVTAGLVALNGLSTPRRGTVIVLQVTARHRVLEHHVGLARHGASAGREQLVQAIPGLGLQTCDAPATPPASSVHHLWLSTRRRPLDTGDPERLAHQILVALSGCGPDKYVALRWVLGPVRRPMAVGTRVPTSKTDTFVAALTAPLVPPGELDSEARRALRDKQGRPGWRALGAVAINAASTARERQLLGRLLGALRTSQGPGVQLGVRRAWPSGPLPTQPRRWPLALNTDELTGLVAFPIGDHGTDLPVNRRTSRLLPPPAAVPSAGRIVADSTYPGRERPVAMSEQDATFHTHLLGPTGSGKSVLIGNLVLQDIADGRSVLVVDPKGDLISDILRRLPDHRIKDVVVLDPSDETPVGLNPLAGGAAPELLADQMLALFRGLYESWGPRVQDVLTASLITLARSEDMTLAALPLLLSNPAFRRRLAGAIDDDPLGLGGFWSGYEALSEPERQQAIAPALNRVRPFLLRPGLRAVIGQAKPRFHLNQLFAERKVLLVSLARGVLGPDVANLLGGLVVSQFWNAILARQVVPAARRHPVMAYIDEFQDVIHLNTPLPDVLAQARGMGVGFTLAHQHLGQLPPPVKAAVLANARSRIVWQLSADDAASIARTTPLLAGEDLTSLERFEVYMSLVSNGRVTPFMSGRTRPLPPPLREEDEVRAMSRRRYGVPRREVEAELLGMLKLHDFDDLRDVGTKRRRP